ncbi:MAG: hypothetical protein JWQ24_4698 [Tardiphaga sp.]|nr:hypothetical protein [Tardiphaga sp.]
MESATGEGLPGSELVITPHPSALRAATLSHKGRGKKARYDSIVSSVTLRLV